jgi:pimeloyl-ACP methyl ester carboxylesterase
VAVSSRGFEVVTSADGTLYGYRKMGAGPGVILLHGGMLSSESFVRLGECLAGDFTVYIPDRRGRGASGPVGARYSVVRDVEDVKALVAHTGADSIFGLSSGAIIALESALAIPALRRVAAYEPPYRVGSYDPAAWAPRYERELSRGKLADAMFTVMKGTSGSRLLKSIPHSLAVPLLERGLRENERGAKPDQVPFRELIPTMRFDAAIVNETSVSLERMRSLRADVLLVGGSKSAAFLHAALDALALLISGARRVELRGLRHTAPCNDGKPQIVAAALRDFFLMRGARTE